MARPDYGVAEELEPGLRRVLAPNPSPMTHWGTNTYLVGDRDVAVIDPGPDDPGHFAALMAALAGARVQAVLVTHAHLDHTPLAGRLARQTGAPVLAFGPPDAGRSPVMTRLAREGLAGGGEGVDAAFRPDGTLADGESLEFGGYRLDVLHTPGHFAGHLAFALGDIVLTGDHVMGWASTLVSPPDGDLAAFMATSARLRDRTDRVFHPGHGASVDDPAGRLDWLMAHRMSREAAILATLGSAPSLLRNITVRVYTDLAPPMLPAAERNVLAHLVDLVEKGVVRATPELSVSAGFVLR
jgi:glyoxylase-like metal-dependent hydrolase (beta-lactamase superfamily II)